MLPVTTRPPMPSTLYVAFELGNSEWKLALTTALEQTPRMCTIPARDLKALTREFIGAKKQFGLIATAEVRSCYEAGRDGFWLHRYLASRDVQNRIVDSSSIEVNRRRRRTKTDRLDARKLVTMLMRAEAGEAHVWSVVRVPTVTDEDRRQVHRELLFARRDRGRHTNRIKGLLAAQGVPLARLPDFPTHLVKARLWNGDRLPALLHARLQREWDTVCQYTTRIRALKKERRATATHYQSGDLQHEQGISKAGNRWVRALMINTAWAWLRFQPNSALARWYQTRFGSLPPALQLAFERIHQVRVFDSGRHG